MKRLTDHVVPMSTESRIIVPFCGLRGRGFHFAISSQDAYAVLGHSPWRLGGAGIMASSQGRDQDKRGSVHVHRFIFSQYSELLPGHCVDHIDGDIFNNCRENLRQITRTESKRALALAGGLRDGICYSPIAGWYFCGEARRIPYPMYELFGLYRHKSEVEDAYKSFKNGTFKRDYWYKRYMETGLRRKKHNLTHAESIGWNIADYQLRQELTPTTPT